MLSRSCALLLVSVALLAVLTVSARPLHLARHAAAAQADAHQPSAYSYELVTYELADTSCTQGPTGGTSVTANECTLPPNSIANWFHGFKIKNVDRNSGNYSLALYFESPLCDDFVGYFTNGTFGTGKSACQQVGDYFSFQVREASKHHSGVVDRKNQYQKERGNQLRRVKRNMP